jgi:hypothetical protein
MAEALSDSVHSTVFKATRPAIFSSNASYTSPMPPRATKRMIVKRPASTLPCANAVGDDSAAAPKDSGAGVDEPSSRAAAATSPAHIEQ